MNILIALILVMGLQTSTPTPTPTPAAGLQLPPPLEFKHPATPTPIPTLGQFVIPTNDTIGGVYGFLVQVEEGLKDIPDAGEIDIIPFEDGRLLFSYVKWVFNPGITQELFDPFAPIPDTIIWILFIVIIALGIYLALTLVVFLFKVLLKVWKLVPFIGGGVLFALVPPPPTPFPTPDSYPFQPFDDVSKITWLTTDEAIQSWQMLPYDVRGLFQGIIVMIIVIVGVITVTIFIRGLMESWKDYYK